MGNEVLQTTQQGIDVVQPEQIIEEATTSNTGNSDQKEMIQDTVNSHSDKDISGTQVLEAEGKEGETLDDPLVLPKTPVSVRSHLKGHVTVEMYQEELTQISTLIEGLSKIPASYYNDLVKFRDYLTDCS